GNCTRGGRQSHHKPCQEVVPKIRFKWTTRKLRAIYNRNVVSADRASNTCVLILLEQSLIQGSVGVCFTFQYVELNFLIPRIQNTSFCLVHLLFQQLLLLLRRVVSCLQRLFDDSG